MNYKKGSIWIGAILYVFAVIRLISTAYCQSEPQTDNSPVISKLSQSNRRFKLRMQRISHKDLLNDYFRLSLYDALDRKVIWSIIVNNITSGKWSDDLSSLVLSDHKIYLNGTKQSSRSRLIIWRAKSKLHTFEASPILSNNAGVDRIIWASDKKRFLTLISLSQGTTLLGRYRLACFNIPQNKIEFISDKITKARWVTSQKVKFWTIVKKPDVTKELEIPKIILCK